MNDLQPLFRHRHLKDLLLGDHVLFNTDTAGLTRRLGRGQFFLVDRNA
jgi:hypothetical protein